MMLFHTPPFLLIFLPLALTAYYLAGWRYKNRIALAASLVFLAWGQWYSLALILFLTIVNFLLARRIEQARAQPGQSRRWLLGGMALNLAVLVIFKLLVVYGVPGLPLPINTAGWPAYYVLPLGLSYVVFQLIAYLVDIHNEVMESEEHFLNFALYVLLFPKIVVGPITRYRDLAGQLTQREVTAAAAMNGARRFILGLGKKVLIADTLARLVNPAFGLEAPTYGAGLAWLALLAFALQLYFDFSGYTDMAIGLGQMLGFRLVENFNYPYIAQSIGDFWRRWHISLSSWFRDYVFYPLEFTRQRSDRLRQHLHVLVVFLLTGLWHGLTLNFAIWGLIHGAAIGLETAGFGRTLKKVWRPLRHLYTLLIVMLSWVFFRAPTPQYAGQFLARLAGVPADRGSALATGTLSLAALDITIWLALVLGILFALPLLPAILQRWRAAVEQRPVVGRPLRVGADLVLLLILVAVVATTASAAAAGSIYAYF